MTVLMKMMLAVTLGLGTMPLVAMMVSETEFPRAVITNYCGLEFLSYSPE